MSLISDYFTKQLFYEEKYGKTAILIQRGTFYCCYEYDDVQCENEKDKISNDGVIWEGHIGHAVDLSLILSLKLTRPNNNKKYSIENPNMIGLQVITYEKFLKTLLANDYVVIRIDQEITTDKDENDNVPRFIAEIVSPTMNFNRISLTEVKSNIVCIYIEYIKSKNIHYFDGFLVTSGVAAIDIITGDVVVTEFYSKMNDEAYCAQEIYRFLISHCPKEIIIYIDDIPTEIENHYIKYLDRILELRRYDRSKTFTQINKEFKKINYQTEFFNKLYHDSIDDLLDKLNYGRLALLLLVQYCHEYNGPIENLKYPQINWFDDVFILTHNAALCLEVIPNFRYHNKKKEEINSLLSIMDLTCTPLGKRCLEHLLLNPMIDSKKIETYYNMVDEMLIKFDDFLFNIIEKRLKGLADISRLQRKIELKLVTPKDFSILIRSYVQIIELYHYIYNKDLPHLKKNLNFNIEKLENFVDNYMDLFYIGNLETCVIDIVNDYKIMLFSENPIKQYDQEFNELKLVEKQLDDIDIYLNSLVKGKIKLTTKNAKNGKPVKTKGKGEEKITFFSASPTVANKLIHYNEQICGKLSIINYSATAKIITSPLIESICFKKDELKKNLGLKFLEYFENTMNNMIHHLSLFTPLCHLIGKLDVLHSYAKLSHKNKYFRPTIVHEGSSFLKIKDIRHPIIEKLIEDEYVVNDINLGKINNTDISPYGNILFSTNMCGKSSLIKAVALCIIIAQIGCFTPGIMLYKPYTKLITRLTCQDNIFKGESSYATEMLELRTVLKQSQNSTLVICDEIGRSTENHAAICITVSAVLLMLELKVSFLFASHLHEIVSLPYIKDIDSSLLSINHLTVINDDVNDTLIYDRKLKPNSGSAKYGLSVAKYLKLPANFLEIANKVALYLEKEHEEFLSTKKSRYNANVYLDHCYRCGSKENLITHHIQEQHLADENGYINYMHKNVKNNLQVLCQQCHKNHHYH